MKTIAKDALFAADDLQFTHVPLPPEYGEDVGLQVRKMTGRERAWLEKRFLDGGRAEKDPEAFKWHVISKAVVGEDGSMYFEDSDREAFMAKSCELAESLFAAALKLNNLTEANTEATAKN